jgi:hypothetical protein
MEWLRFNKVFCIGFNKTGTSSIHQLFVNLGLTSWHGYYSHVPVTDPVFQLHQCFSDGDLHNFPLLDQTFPGSRFIVTTRPFDDWLVSRIRYIEYRRSIGATGPMRQEYEANPVQAVQMWIARRLQYHQHVQRYFRERGGDLLVVDICNAVDAPVSLQKIGAFLGVPIPPGMEVPHENAQADHRKPDPGAIRERRLVYEEVWAAFQALGLGQDTRRSVFP